MTTKAELRERSTNIIVETIDETLEFFFGKAATVKVYDCLKKRFMLERNEIPNEAKIFSQFLSAIFGSASSQIELRIIKNLCCKSGLDFDPNSPFDFVDCVAAYKAVVKYE